MKKLIISAITIVLLFTGCSGTNAETNTETNSDTPPIKILYSGWNYSIVYDTETGVEYIEFRGEFRGGSLGGITPRLDADGNPILYHKITQKGATE